ncbi:MAG: NAD(P)(+) transhydrogenase (Re/Si-specific) subunit beta, partial [Bacteroidota bacterium]
METLIQIGYLVALVCFVLGIKGMSHPDTARRGNWTLALGMGLATLVTLMQPGLGNLPLILISLGLGSWWGMRMSSKAQMTEMPQMVSLLNGFGGLAAALVALSEVVDMFYGDAMVNLLMEAMGMGVLGQYNKASALLMEDALLGLGLLREQDIREQNPANPAYKKYFPHGTGHF